jgi:hypothetical protein
MNTRQKRRVLREAVLAVMLSGATGFAIVGLLYGPTRSSVFLCGLVVALMLSFERLCFRGIYAIIEIGFGSFVLWNAAGKGHGSFSAAFGGGLDNFQDSVVLIQTFGAIYILVRGLDNSLKALPPKTRKCIEKRVENWDVELTH